ncbi:MAG: hypothetical protein KDE53_00985 [Caldilineaceae bacterium]|nr:hypothetical protein [Caldilineaceae bacterium]
MLLQLTDGTTTIILNNDSGTPTAPFVGARYFPRDPGTGATVAESIQVAFSGSNSVLKTQANIIERLLLQATTSHLPTVYLEYHHGITGNTHRSPIIGGRVTWSDERPMREVYQGNAFGEFTVIVERENYWEGPDSYLGFTMIRNGNSSPYNFISLSDIQGTMPAPLRVQMTNNNGTALATSRFYLTVDHIGLSSNEHLLAGGTATWSEAIDHDMRLVTMPIPPSYLTKAAGDEIQVIAAFTDLLASNIYLRANIYTTISGIPILSKAGNEVKPGLFDKLINLGTLPIPPDGVATTDMALVLTAYCATAGSLNLNFAQITPARNALALRQTGYNLVSNAAIVEDGEQAYMLDGSDKYGVIHRSGGPLMVQPGRTNRLSILFTEISFNASRTLLVNVNYRPRRATI